MVNLNKDAQTVLNNLRAHADSSMSDDWGMIYLDDARKGMASNKFRAQLVVLSKAGLYKVVDGSAWGEVKLED